MDTNDSLRIESLWHSMHAISQQLSRTVSCTRIELLEADTFDLHCFQSLIGAPSLHQIRWLVVCKGMSSLPSD
ncbi:Trafficking protein particle complex subunit 4 [Nymphaea thermarum]|nr:Trafficking protein particle complex subunit 4 [Nymphaea thermarum]